MKVRVQFDVEFNVKDKQGYVDAEIKINAVLKEAHDRFNYEAPTYNMKAPSLMTCRRLP